MIRTLAAPFATGADFSVKMTLGDAEWTKEPSAIEDKAYRDMWGQGLDSYLQMMYERFVIMRELLSDTGSIYVHCDHRVNFGIRCILDRISAKSETVQKPQIFQNPCKRSMASSLCFR